MNYHIDLAKEGADKTALVRVTWRWTLSTHHYPSTGTAEQWPYGITEEPVVEVLDTGSNPELRDALDEAQATIAMREFLARYHPVTPDSPLYRDASAEPA